MLQRLPCPCAILNPPPPPLPPPSLPPVVPPRLWRPGHRVPAAAAAGAARAAGQQDAHRDQGACSVEEAHAASAGRQHDAAKQAHRGGEWRARGAAEEGKWGAAAGRPAPVQSVSLLAVLPSCSQAALTPPPLPLLPLVVLAPPAGGLSAEPAELSGGAARRGGYALDREGRAARRVPGEGSRRGGRGRKGGEGGTRERAGTEGRREGRGGALQLAVHPPAAPES